MAAHRYWRLLMHTNGGNAFMAVCELAGHIVLSGANVLTGGTASASGFVAGDPASNAFDNNLATYWAQNPWADPVWLEYDLGAGNSKDIIEIAVTSPNVAPDTTPTSADWQFSDDNLTWTTYFSYTTATYTATNQTKTFATGPTASERVTTADVLVAVTISSVSERVTSAGVLAAINFPSPFERVTWAGGLIAAQSTIPLRVTEAVVLVAVKGRTANPKLRAWTFTLDGHDFYVLRLGDTLTLVYDVYSEQWMDWDAFGETYWPVNKGINWVGGTGILEADGSSPGSNVLVGDDTYGLLWFLNPMQPYDQNPEIIDLELRYFTRTIMGQVPMVGREVLPCYSVWLTTDMGAPAYLGAGVTLSISDDGGATFSNMGLVSVTPGNNTPELSWYSLGQIQAPGRLFKIVDDGAVTRIDGMEMNDPDAK